MSVLTAQSIERSAAVADMLEADGALRSGARVVAALENSPRHVELVAAAWRLGLEWIAVPPSASAPTFSGILRSAAPAAAFVDTTNERLMRALGDWARAVRAHEGIAFGFAGAMSPNTGARPERRTGHWQNWLEHLPPAVFYTSGSTSTAKGVPLRWPRILQKARAVLDFYGVSAEDRVMPILPLSHVYGLYWWMGALDRRATCIVPRESSSPAALAKTLAAEGASVLACPPIVGAFLFGRHGCDAAVRERLRVLTMGGAATSTDQAKRILAALPRTRVFLSYGLAETYSTIACNEISLPGADLASVGPLRFGAFGEVREGELCVGGTVMEGYLDGVGADAFTADGLFRTGDLVRTDADGALTITGRVKEMINAGGLSIYPAEIEQAIRAHPAVADCGVFGEKLGELEVVCAAVALRSPATLDELLDHCRKQLAPKMMPRRIVFVDAIPRGALGKIARAELRKLAASTDARRLSAAS